MGIFNPHFLTLARRQVKMWTILFSIKSKIYIPKISRIYSGKFTCRRRILRYLGSLVKILRCFE